MSPGSKRKRMKTTSDDTMSDARSSAHLRATASTVVTEPSSSLEKEGSACGSLSP
jgi:hypothetical protein